MADFRKLRRDEKPLMKDIDDHVVEKWASKWKELGSQLNVGEHLIRNIEYDHPSDCERCCRIMLSKWLEQTAHPTWEMLISALDQVSDNAADTHLQHASNYLRDQYIDGRFANTEDDWPPYQPKHYTTLALIHHENSTDAKVLSLSQKLATEGNISKVLPTNSKDNEVYNETTKSLAEIFTFTSASTGNSNIILIEGAPGIGKTVLSKEIGYLWASNKLLSCIKILLLVFIRNLYADNVKSLNSFMHHIFRNTKIANDVGEYFYNNGGKDLAIVLDGYDEISEKDKNNSFINDIINRKVFTKCLLVITSRPTASSCLHNTVNYRIEVVGFTEEDRLKYIETALPDSHKKVEDLQLYLHANPTINALCYIPLNMTILLCLSLKGTENLPKTQTDLYGKFIEMTVIRFLKKYDDKLSTGVHINIFELPYPHNNILKELLHLAFKALQEDRLIFTINELKVSCPTLTAIPNNWNGLGLLKSVKYFNFDKSEEVVTYHFLHFSIQEYMAAFYISTLSNSQQIKLMRCTFWTIRYYNTWIMYVGITGGESFALKHFLSGNWFHFLTRLSKPSISKKLVSNKIKRLHMFQCLAETRNHDIISLVGNFFENQEINLSSQTLLPSDLNTLGFFLIRSRNKHWKILNLSRCNIGDNGSTSLSKKLSDKGAHQISIEKVDLSYNLLNLQSVVKLFELFKCWNVSELIVTDFALPDITTSRKLYSEIEHNFIQFNAISTLQLTSIGSFLFACTVDRIMSLVSSTVINSIYLLNCSITNEFLHWLHNQNLENVHLLNTSVTKYIYLTEIIMLLNDEEAHMVVYDSNLSNQEKIINLAWSKNQKNSIMLIIGKYIQGIIVTHSLSSKLSNLEILNLIVKMRSPCCSSVPVVNLWRHDLKFYGDKSESIIHSFIQFLPKITSNIHLKIKLVEGRTFIAHQIKYEDICEDIMIHMHSETLSAIYLSSCEFKESICETNVLQGRSLSSFTVLNSNLDFRILLLQSSTKLRLFRVKYLFLHSTNHRSNLSLQTIIANLSNTSMVLLTQDVLTVCNPTTEQLALAYQLESSFTVWKFFSNCHSEVFYLILTMLTQRKWDELDFSCCNIGNTEYKIINEYIQTNKCELKIDAITISSLKLADQAFAKFLTTGNTEKVTISNSDTKFYLQVSGIKKIARASKNTFLMQELNINTTEQAAVAIANVLSHNENLKILNISGNNLQANGIIKLMKGLENTFSLCNVMMCSNNCTEEAANHIAAVLSNNKELQVVKLNGNYLQTKGITTIAQGLKSISTLQSLEIEYNGCTKDIADDLATVLSHNIYIQVLNLNGNNLQAEGIKKIAKALHNTCTLQRLEIGYNNCAEAADDIAVLLSHNVNLKVLNLNGNYFRANDIKKIANGLMNTHTLQSLEIEYSYCIGKAAYDIAIVLSHNKEIQVLNLSGNNLGTNGIKLIAKALKKNLSLQRLEIAYNNCTGMAANNLAYALFSNTNLRVLNLTGNNLEAQEITTIISGLSTSTLQTLELGDNKCTDEVIENLVAVLSHNTNIHTLNLSRNRITKEGIITIMKSLRNHFNLCRLIFNQNAFTDKEADYIEHQWPNIFRTRFMIDVIAS